MVSDIHIIYNVIDKKNYMNKEFKGNGVRDVISDKCKTKALSLHLPTSFDYYNDCRDEIISLYNRRENLRIIELEIPRNLHQCDIENAGRYLFKKWNIEMYVSSRNKCVENSGIIRTRQYVYFPETDNIRLCDDIYTGLKKVLKPVLKKKGFQVLDEVFYEE